MSARTHAVEVVAARIGTVTIEVHADQAAVPAASAAGAHVGERREVRFLDWRGRHGRVYHGAGDDEERVRALFPALLDAALRDAGVVRRIAPLQPPRQALAVAWLTCTLDAEVALPVAVVCDALGIDASLLAAAVRARATS